MAIGKFFKRALLTAAVGASLFAPFVRDFSPRNDSAPQTYSLEEKVVAAHRGGMERYPENTKEAIAYAGKTGAEAVEIDVRKSADNLVVHHDAKIDGKRVSNLGYEEMNQSRQYQVPKLDQALKIIKKEGKTAIIDIKERGCGKEIIETAKRTLQGEKIIASSQYPDTLKQIKQDYPEIKTTLVVGTGRGHLYNTARILTGVVPWGNIKKSGADYVSVDGRYLNPRFYKNASKGDVGVLVYGIDKPSDIRNALQRPPVYGVIVDKPSEAVRQRNYLEKTNTGSVEEKPVQKSLEHIVNLFTFIFAGILVLMLASSAKITGNAVGINDPQNWMWLAALLILGSLSILISRKKNY